MPLSSYLTKPLRWLQAAPSSRDVSPGCRGLRSQHKSNTSPGPGGVQHAGNTNKTAFSGTLWRQC
jgi:hypothetical protein